MGVGPTSSGRLAVSNQLAGFMHRFRTPKMNELTTQQRCERPPTVLLHAKLPSPTPHAAVLNYPFRAARWQLAVALLLLCCGLTVLAAVMPCNRLMLCQVVPSAYSNIQESLAFTLRRKRNGAVPNPCESLRGPGMACSPLCRSFAQELGPHGLCSPSACLPSLRKKTL